MRAKVTAYSVALTTCFVALFAIHVESYWSIVNGWMSSTTYNHGFLVVPLCIALAWRQRAVAVKKYPRPSWLGLAGIVLLSFAWSVAAFLSVQIISQLAVVGLVMSVVLAIGGPQQVRRYGFPLGYLFFVVPFGDGVIPILMEFTADFTIAALNLVAVPVIRDGLYFSTTSGDFEVAKACSGVRYLLASTMLGVAYAFITYRKLWKRVAFICLAVIFPIIANGFRAFGIVLIAHFSDLKYAVGVDHLIYGWVFFGAVMLVLFMIGNRFADPVSQNAPLIRSGLARNLVSDQHETGPGKFALMSILVLIGLASAPAFLSVLKPSITGMQVHLPRVPDSEAGWSGPINAKLLWRPGYHGADLNIDVRYLGTDGAVEVRIAAYTSQEQGKELVNSQNRLSSNNWNARLYRAVELPDTEPGRVNTAAISQGGRQYFVWYWHQVGVQTSTANFHTKWLELSALAGDPQASMLIAVAADGDRMTAENRMRDFLSRFGAGLVACVVADQESQNCVLPPTVSGIDN